MWVKDDSTLVLILVHEVGHMRQYARGDAFPADAIIKECSKISADECDKKFPRPSFRLEDNADDFMMDFTGMFRWQDHSFNPFSTVDFFKNVPDSPLYRPSAERARLLNGALVAQDVEESDKASREWIKLLEQAVELDSKN